MVFWLGFLLLISAPVVVVVGLVLLFWHICVAYLPMMPRIFLEKPLFNIPRGDPIPSAELVRFATTNGLMLTGCYLKTAKLRRGVILFGLEFGSDVWSCWPYVEFLVEAGFDVFAYEPRNQGTSDSMPGYEPLQWLTYFEVDDARAALRYLKSRPDADPRGIGFFGISKGGNAGLYLATEDPTIRCCLTDGAFGTFLLIVPYMRRWFRIYNNKYQLQGLLPSWYYRLLAGRSVAQVERDRKCRYALLEQVVVRLRGRPLFMIHGECDSYIEPEMARALFDRAGGDDGSGREFWLVPGARHNQALHLVGEDYRRRVLEFFLTHLADPGVNGHVGPDSRNDAEGTPLRVDPSRPTDPAPGTPTTDRI